MFDQNELRDTIHEAMRDLTVDLQGVSETLQDLGMSQQSEGTENDVENAVFSVGTPARLNLRTVAGRVHIIGTDEEVIRLQATKRGTAGARRNTSIEWSHHGNEVTVRTRQRGQGLMGMVGGSMAAVDFEITVPRHCAFDLNAVSADLEVEGTEGDLTLRTVSGDIRVRQVQGELSFTTVSGDIRGEQLSGELMVRSTSGDATFRQCTFPGFNLHNVSGDFHLETPLSPTHYQARTVSGDLHLAVPADTGATLRLKSVSGSTQVSGLPVEVIKSSRRNWQGRINGGGADVELNTVSGDLHVQRAGEGSTSEQPAPSPAATPPPPPPTASDRREERTRILDLLAQGEIDVDEAMARLAQLG